jgi:hypothetical protein
MRDELEAALLQKYPKIFDKNFYFSCGDGWFNIIDTLCAVIQGNMANKRYSFKEITDEEFEEEYHTRAVQVKEKFGGLRFYVDNGDDYTYGAITHAESISMRTCELCGNPGIRRAGPWIRVRCDACDEAKE